MLAQRAERIVAFVPRGVTLPNGERAETLDELAAAFLARHHEVPRHAPGSRRPLTLSQQALIVALVQHQRFTQVQAAAVVGCDQATVSRVLRRWCDTRSLAKQYLQSKALPLAERVVDVGLKDAAVALRVLEGVGKVTGNVRAEGSC